MADHHQIRQCDSLSETSSVVDVKIVIRRRYRDKIIDQDRLGLLENIELQETGESFSSCRNEPSRTCRPDTEHNIVIYPAFSSLGADTAADEVVEKRTVIDKKVTSNEYDKDFDNEFSCTSPKDSAQLPHRAVAAAESEGRKDRNDAESEHPCSEDELKKRSGKRKAKRVFRQVKKG